MIYVFCWQHIVYMILFTVVAAGATVLIKKKINTKRSRDILLKSLGGALLVSVTLNRIFIGIDEQNFIMSIPDTLCGVANVSLGICALVCKKDSLPLHCLLYIAFFGGIANTIYPYYLPDYDRFLHPTVVTAFLHHGLALMVAVAMYVTGYFKPQLKKVYALPVGLCLMVCYGTFLIDALGFECAVNVNKALVPGTFLTWYVVFPAMVAAVVAAVAVYEYVLKRRKVKEASTAADAEQFDASEEKSDPSN